jgi:hypothetical protein
VPTSVQLVPPSLKVIASIMANKKDPRYAVAKLIDRVEMCHSYAQLDALGYPKIKVATTKLGHFLVCTYTERQSHHPWTHAEERKGLVWIAEESCHPICSFLGRECCGNLSTFEWLQLIEKKHIEWLDRLPVA